MITGFWKKYEKIRKKATNEKVEELSFNNV